MELLTAAATILGLIGAAGGAVGYFAKARGDAIIAYQEKALKLRDEDIVRLQAINDSLAKERDSLLSRVEFFQDLMNEKLNGNVSSAIESLTKEVQQLHEERKNGRK